MVLQGRAAFINYLLWYLGCMFSLTGIALIAGLAMLRAGYEFGARVLPIGLFFASSSFQEAISDKINVVNLFIAVIVAVLCRVRFWMAVPAWTTGFLALWILKFVHGLAN